MDEYLESNRKLWNDWTGLHVQSDFYDIDGFKAGAQKLDSVELELGPVAGKSLLHLQCHFGLGTLSWARLGARVTGVDFSERATELARRLGRETGIDAEFICANIYELPSVLSGQYDRVFTSHGVLSWLPDLARWGQIVAQFLKPGGLFYIVEGHPFAQVFDDEATNDLHVRFPYFQGAEPLRFDVRGSYASLDSSYRGVEYSWNHPIGEILAALLGAGLRLSSFQEYPFLAWRMFPFMEPDAAGWWRLPDRFPQIPLMFSVKAMKPDGT
jgi:SAM-dependent methyltransferase